MRYKYAKNRILSTLLTVIMILCLFPIPAYAAVEAVGTASGTAGYDSILVYLSIGEFSTVNADVTNDEYWLLTATGGQTITSIIKQNSTSVRINLSGSILEGNTFTLQALPSVFAEGTNPFAAPITVTIHVPTPAEGTATATAGTKNISVTLSRGAFAPSAATVQNVNLWILGGASAAANPIASITRIDATHALVTLTNNINESDTYTISVLQSVFVNVMTAPFVEPLTVTIAPGESSVCEIDGTGYPTIDAALNAADEDNTTITLLTTITYEGELVVDGKSILFDLGENDFNVDNSGNAGSGTGLVVANGGSVDIAGSGSFTVLGTQYGVRVYGSGSSAAVTGATATYEEGIAVFADGDNTSITITGPVTAAGVDGVGVRAYGSVNVTGTIQANEAGGRGITSLSGGSVAVTGNVMAANIAVTANDGGEVNVTGDVSTSGDESKGVYTFDHGDVSITGDVTVAGQESKGIIAVSGEVGSSTVNVTGNVSAGGANCIGVEVSQSTVTVTGNVTVTSDGSVGVYAHDDSMLTIGGGVSQIGDGTGSGGVICRESQVTIDGTINVENDSNYIKIGEGWRSEDFIGFGTPDPAKPGYIKYAVPGEGETAVVWVGNSSEPSETIPTVLTYEVSDITASGALLSGSITSNGGEAVTARGFVYSINPNPTIINHVIPSAGTNEHFTATLTGLTPGVTYHVRAYATNSVGTAYGTDRSFTMPLVFPPSEPGNRTYLACDRALELCWEAPVNDGGSPVLRYEIRQHNYENWIDVGLNTSYTVNRLFDNSELINGASYTFYVRAVNVAGSGTEGMIQGTPNIPRTPGPPRGINALTSSHQVKLTWTAPYSNGYRNITHYEASWDNGQTWIETEYNDAHTFTGLTNDTTYTFRVRAVNSIGSGESVVITATPRAPGGGYASGGGGSSSIVDPQPAAKVLDSNGNTNSTITIKVDNSTDTAMVEMPAAALNNAFDKSDADSAGVKVIKVDIPGIAGAGTYALVLPSSFLSSGDSSMAIELKTALASVTIPGNMMTAENASGVQTVTLTVTTGNKNSLNSEVQAQIGDRPIIELNLKLDGHQTSWNNETAPVIISIPYSPTTQELANPESIIIWYIDGSGNAVCVPNGRYDPAAGTVTFTTDHFSFYAVGYNTINFSDVVKDAWYGKAVSFIAARGITTGAGNGKFNPEAKLTRGQFIVMLMKAYDISPDSNPMDNFSDAGSTYYTGYLAGAKRLGISAGVGNNLFVPEKEITRQEMFTLLYNALKGIGKLPRGNSGKSLSSFGDATDIAPWARDAIKLLAESGTISGSGGKLTPADYTTRGQIAQVLNNLLSK